MDSNNSFVKEISLVPDYKALEIILANRAELDSFIQQHKSSNNSDTIGQYLNSSSSSRIDDNPTLPIIADICRHPNYVSFRKCLTDTEEYLNKRLNRSNLQLNSSIASSIGINLKSQLKCTKEEIVMILNMLPMDDSLVEMMFPGRFSKKEITILMDIVSKLN